MLKAVMLAAMLPVAAAVGVARGDAPVLRPQSGTTPMTAPQTAGECTTYSVFRDGVRDGVWRMDDATFMHEDVVRLHGETHRLNLTACISPTDTGTSHTRHWLVGPFESRGGYDWWELDFEIPWDNTLLGTGSAHEQRAIGGYSFTFHRGTPPKDTSSAAGAIIGLPPLHHHHTTFVFGGGGSATASNGMGGTQALSLLGQSDAQCSGEAAGFSCLNVDLAQSGYALLTTSAAMAGSRVGAHVNDVRPAGSPAFVWYYNVTMTFVEPSLVAARELTAVSEYSSSYALNANSQFRTFNVPAASDSFAIYEATWPFSGTLDANPHFAKHHSHVGHFHYNFLLSASAAELGLHQPRFYSPTGCDAVATTDAGFASNTAMLDHLVRGCPQCFSLHAPRTRLLCTANASVASVTEPSLTGPVHAAYRYNRRAVVRCSAERLSVTRGQVYTSLSFFGTQPTFPGPAHLYSSSMNEDGFYPMHSTWNFLYTATGDSVGAQQIKRDVAFPMLSAAGAYNAQRCSAPDLADMWANESAPVQAEAMMHHHGIWMDGARSA